MISNKIREEITKERQIAYDKAMDKATEKSRKFKDHAVLDPTWSTGIRVGKIVSSPKPHLTGILDIINNGTKEFTKLWNVYPTHVNIGRKEARDLSHRFGTSMNNLRAIKCLGMRLVPFFEVYSMLEIERIENEVENEDIPVPYPEPYPEPYPPPAPPFPTPPSEKLSGGEIFSTYTTYPQYYYTSDNENNYGGQTIDGVSLVPGDKIIIRNGTTTVTADNVNTAFPTSAFSDDGININEN